MKTCLIFGAGEYYGLPETDTLFDIVIAADGGLAYADREHIKPTFCLGDFDSFDGTLPKDIPVQIHPTEKDDTDMLLALKWGLGCGCDRFFLCGGVGGRTDHTLANLQSLAYLASCGTLGFLFDREFVYTVISPKFSPFSLPGSIPFRLRENGKLSVFAFGGDARGVTLSGGLKYKVTDAALSPFFPVGVSNEYSGNAEISLSEGYLLLCLPI